MGQLEYDNPSDDDESFFAGELARTPTEEEVEAATAARETAHTAALDIPAKVLLAAGGRATQKLALTILSRNQTVTELAVSCVCILRQSSGWRWRLRAAAALCLACLPVEPEWRQHAVGVLMDELNWVPVLHDSGGRFCRMASRCFWTGTGLTGFILFLARDSFNRQFVRNPGDAAFLIGMLWLLNCLVTAAIMAPLSFAWE
ncbi:MAG TPA: hypothetical protein VGS41_08420, partial [Chthonomonadales bacterium]|nr:hypothetical protein [Chthonomonadales bacterium]